RFQSVYTNNAVEFLKSVLVSFRRANVVTGHKDVARIEAHAEPRMSPAQFENHGQLFEAAIEGVALAGGGFHAKRYALGRIIQYFYCRLRYSNHCVRRILFLV